MSNEKVKEQLFFNETDYVVAVNQHQDGSSAIATIARELKKAGFYVAATNATNDPKSPVLFLVRMSPETLSKSAASFQSRDVLSGVPTPAFSLDGEGITPALRERLAFETLQEAGLTPDRSKAIQAVWPYTHPEVGTTLLKKSLGMGQDIPFVRSHYGDEIAMYFAFASYTSKLILVPAALGIAGHLLGPYNPYVGSLLVAWAVYYTFGWRYNESKYTQDWNTYNVETITTRRQDYKGSSPRARQLRSLLYLPCAAFLCALYVTGVVFGLGTEVFLTQLYDGPFKSVLALAPTGGYIVLAQIFRLIYDKFTDAYIKFEDYPTEEEQEKQRGQREFWATFFLNYTPILLSAYLYLPFGHLIAYNLGTIRSSVAGYTLDIVPEFELNTERLAAQTKYYAVTNQLVLLLTDVGVPYVKAFLAKRKIKPSYVTPAQTGYALPAYNVNSDYLIITSLLGYALLTAPVWPLAPFAVALGVLVRTKATSLKLACEYRRPNVRRVNSIGSWNSNILFLVGLASVTVPTLIAMYRTTAEWSANNSFVALTPVAVLTLAFLCENIFLVVSKAIEASFRALAVVPSKQLPLVQSNAPPRPTASDLEWKNHVLEDDIRSLK